MGTLMNMSYEDRFILMKPNCGMCNKFPFGITSMKCDYRFDRKAYVLRNACRDGFIPISKEVYLIRQLLEVERIKKNRILYRHRHREELRVEAREYTKTHREQKSKWDSTDRALHPDKYKRKGHKDYLKHKKRYVERARFRSYIEYYNPLRLILRNLRYTKRQEEKLIERERNRTDSTRYIPTKS